MNDILRERLMRKLDSLPDERIYQIFDYIDFLESRYAQRSGPGSNRLQTFAEGVEDTLRAGRIGATAVAGTMTVMGRAVSAINTVAAAGKSVATEFMTAASGTPSDKPGEPPAPPTQPPGEQRK
ncbi:MAG: hypothetical protein WKF63_02505 [Thermomicrobiales bacterium]